MQKPVPRPDLSEVLDWETAEIASQQLRWLIDNVKQPHPSVVVKFGPEGAKRVINICNKRNRPLSTANAARLARMAEIEQYELTGDTIKISISGRLLDGQHRLMACALQNLPVITHVVFGLDDDIFDVIDQGKKRTPGDVLAQCGVRDYNMVAATVRQVVLISEKRRGWDTGGGGRAHNSPPLNPRRIRELAEGPLRGVSRYIKEGIKIGNGFDHPPSMVAAILYLIGQYDPAKADEFAHDWQHGNRNYKKNINFNKLDAQILSIKNKSGGTLHRATRCALIIQCFNHWNAGIEAGPRGISWDRKAEFPSLEFDGAAFKQRRLSRRMADTSLPTSQERLLEVMMAKADKDGIVSVPLVDLSQLANIHQRSLQYVISTLISGKRLYLHKKEDGKGAPKIYRLPLPVKKVA